MRLIPVARLRALSLSSSVLAAMTLSACGPESAADLGQQVLGALTSAQLVSTATEWRTLPIGAGGFITGLNLNPDGVTRVIRTDTYGAYIWRDNRWQQLVTETSMPAEDRYEPNGTNAGVIDVASAPSNPQRLYMYFKGFIYRSDNQGVNWSRTTFPLAEADANGEFRRGTQHIAIDPSDPNHVLVGTPSKGLLVTFDGGTSWQTVADVPGGTDEVNNEGVARPGGGITVFFAPKSGLTSGGLTREIYAGSWRKGLWRSQDSGASWQQISGNGTGPTVAWRHDVANDGTLYVAERIVATRSGVTETGPGPTLRRAATSPLSLSTRPIPIASTRSPAAAIHGVVSMAESIGPRCRPRTSATRRAMCPGTVSLTKTTCRSARSNSTHRSPVAYGSRRESACGVRILPTVRAG